MENIAVVVRCVAAAQKQINGRRRDKRQQYGDAQRANHSDRESIDGGEQRFHDSTSSLTFFRTCTLHAKRASQFWS